MEEVEKVEEVMLVEFFKRSCAEILAEEFAEETVVAFVVEDEEIVVKIVMEEEEIVSKTLMAEEYIATRTIA